METKIIQLFSKVVSVENFEFDKEKIVSEVYKIKFRKPPADNQSECLQILEEKIFNHLKKPLMDRFYYFAHNVLKYKKNQEFAITTSWITKTVPGGNSRVHHHRNCMFSGVLYLKTYPKKAKISFWNPHQQGFYLIPSEYNIYNSDNYCFALNEKNLLFFPSEMQHKIETNETDSDRLSLAFNIIPINKFGEADSSVNIALINDL
jgi:uncharacterized protein (TIGR02466 family)